jgi:hypothetical protein
MIAKCAEALALRKGWPDDFSNVYAAEEIDRARALDLLPADLANKGEVDARQLKIGGPSILVDWLDDKPLEPVPVGQFAARAMAFVNATRKEPSQILMWVTRNRHGLKEFWAHNKSDALALRKEVEAATGGHA